MRPTDTLLQQIFARENGSYSHFILRKSAGLVATDNGGTSQSLDGLEILH